MPAYLARVDLDRRIGADRVTSYLDDSGNEAVDAGTETAVLDGVMDEAEALAAGCMRKAGYDFDAVTTFAQADPYFKLQVAWCACELLAERRTEFTDSEGWGPYKMQWERALEHFDKLATGMKRAIGEAAAGTNPQVKGKVSPKPPAGTTDQFQFAPSKSNPTGRGGF